MAKLISVDINVLSFIKIAIVHRSDCYFRDRFNLYYLSLIVLW
ncbi:MAG: hypothetical protein ACKERF_01770 [Candidatus Hodgkinia cicadicola]